MGGKMVDFAGWEMPLNYGSQLEEHRQVRADVGMFDVSHMTIIDLEGGAARPFLRRLLANSVDSLQHAGQALYSCMLNDDGGIVDDLIVYFMHDDWFRMVVNAATRDKDLAWIRKQANGFDVEINARDDLAMVAVQGPNACARLCDTLTDISADRLRSMAAFTAMQAGELFIARTGYTGEDGFEIMLSAPGAVTLWQRLHDHGVAPIGLGARDTLRLEAGMNLYGADMDERVSPLEAALSWTVAWEPADRAFIGRAALERQRADGVAKKMVGLVLQGRGVLRNHQKVVGDAGDGEVLSGSFSPTLARSIAFARVPMATGAEVEVEIRGGMVPARVVKAPFVHNEKLCLHNGM